MKDTKVLRTLLFAAALLLTNSHSSRAVEFFLRAEATTKTMPDGVAVPMWGFALDSAFGANNGTLTVPGPTLTVPPGDPNLIIHLDNNLSVPVSLVISGQNAVMTPVRFTDPNGRQRIRSFTHETSPGNGTPVDYVWTNVRPGTYIYHSGTHPAVQVQMGLYGGVIKDYATNPSYQQAYPTVAYSVSVPLFFSEIDPALHNAVNTDNYGPGKAVTSTIDYEPKYFLINGEVFVPGQTAVAAGASGGGTLLRLFNMGLETRSPLLQGAYMTLMAEDGRVYRHPKEQYVAPLPAGKTLDAIVVFPAAGTYPLYDRRLGLTNAQATGGGMLKKLEVATGSFWPVINSVTATPASIADTQTSQLLVGATDTDGPLPLSYTWTVPVGAGSLSDPALANPVFTPAAVTGPMTHTLTVVVSDGTHVDIGAVDVTVAQSPPPPEVFVDNLDPETSSVGEWGISGAAGFWDENSVWSRSDGGSFTFPADLRPGTAYAVYAWWTQWPSRYTAVPYEIRSGTTLLGTVNVNQKVKGGQWNLLGTYLFANAAGSVTIRATPGATVSTCADAVRFVPVTLTEVFVDNLDPGTSSMGEWGISGASGYWGQNSVWSRSDGGSFTFTANLIQGEAYAVYAWWTQWPSRYTAVPYEIRGGTTLLGTVNVDQKVNGGQWNLLGTYTFSGTPSVKVLATPGSTLSTSADAVRFVPAP